MDILEVIPVAASTEGSHQGLEPQLYVLTVVGDRVGHNSTIYGKEEDAK